MRIVDRATWADYRQRPGLIMDLLWVGLGSFCVATLTVVLVLRTGSWEWLQRSGAPCVVVGTILFGRPSYRVKLKRHQLTEDLNEELDEAGTEELLQRRADQVVSMIGLTLSCVGSLVWAYGDLLPKSLLHHSH